MSIEFMDPKKLKELMALMKEFNLSELLIEEDDKKLHLTKAVPQPSTTVIREAVSQPVSMAMPAQGNLSTVTPVEGVPAVSAVPAGPAAGEIGVESPMVGTFYRSPAPEKPAFVNVGDVVEKDTVVCIIEAMKVMNEIKAEKRGRVKSIPVEDTEAVEFGQVLFVLESV